MITKIYVPIENKMSFSTHSMGLQKKLGGYTYDQWTRHVSQMRENETKYFEDLIDATNETMEKIAKMSDNQVSVSKSFLTYCYAFPVMADMKMHGIMDLKVDGDYLILTSYRNLPIIEAKAEVVARLQKTCVYYMDEIKRIASKSYPYFIVSVDTEDLKNNSDEGIVFEDINGKKKNRKKANLPDDSGEMKYTAELPDDSGN